MEKIFGALETLYGTSEIPFFLSDEYGNIKWKNSACGKSIIFPDGLSPDCTAERVSIDGTLFTALASPHSFGADKFILWRVNTLTDVLMQLGSTDTYTDICYMLSESRNDVAKAEQGSDVNAKFNSIKRNIEVLSELTAVIYHRAPRSSAVYFIEKLTQIINDANKVMSRVPVVFRLNIDQTIESDIPVNISERLLYVCMFSILKAIVRCSDRELFVLKADLKGSDITVSSSFSLSGDTHIGMITDDFEMYCAELYIAYIGGKMDYTTDNGIGKIEISIPAGDSKTLNSPLYSVPEDTCRNLAEIFLSDISGKIK